MQCFGIPYFLSYNTFNTTLQNKTRYHKSKPSYTFIAIL
jgi:hypothetical protein